MGETDVIWGLVVKYWIIPFRKRTDGCACSYAKLMFVVNNLDHQSNLITNLGSPT